MDLSIKISIATIALSAVAIFLTMLSGNKQTKRHDEIMEQEQRRHTEQMAQSHFHFAGEVFMRDKEFSANQSTPEKRPNGS